MQVSNFSSESIIREELSKIYGKRGLSATSAKIRCPFHSERTASLNINLSRGVFKKGREIPVGAFRCFGCGKSGGWNLLAEELKLKKIGSSDLGDMYGYARISVEEPTLIISSIEELADYFRVGLLLDFNEYETWRGISGLLMSKLGCKICLDDRDFRKLVLIPSYVNGELVGGFKAVYEKQSKKDLSFLNSSGDWVKTKGLFPFDYVSFLLEEKDLNYVVLVEGQRDALRLIENDLPALAILGTNNWSEDKLELLLSLGIEKVYIMMDGDTAGKQAERSIIKSITETNLVDYHVFNLRAVLKEINSSLKVEEQLTKIDPMELPLKYIKKMKRKIQEFA